MTHDNWILLAEDNASDAELTLRVLTAHEPLVDIIVARDGVEALDCLQSCGKLQGRVVPTNPTLVLLDLKMPRRDGLQVLRQIKADRLLNSIPVVMFTSSGEETDLRRCYQLGANAYVIKPVGFEDFSKALESIVLFWTVVNQPPPAAGAGKPENRPHELGVGGRKKITRPDPGPVDWPGYLGC